MLSLIEMNSDYSIVVKSCQIEKSDKYHPIKIPIDNLLKQAYSVCFVGGYMNIDKFMRIITNDRLQRKFTQRFYYVVWFFLVIFWGYFICRLL